MDGAHRKLNRLLRKHGLRLKQTRRHYKIYDQDGRCIAVASSSASCPYWMENTVKDLVSAGALPADVPRRWR